MQLELFTEENPFLFSGKMSPECLQPQIMHLDASLVNWLAQSFKLEPQKGNTQVQVWLPDESELQHGAYWMPNISEHPREEEDSFSLHQMLEGGGQILQKYYLSIQACQGILRRAEARGIALPEELKLVLLATVN
jgi:hypothetical protein